MKLGTIEQEADACRKAFANSKVGDWAWHIHHTELCEQITESIENRIQCILTKKAESERALRLRLMRPMSKRAEKVCNTALAEDEKVRDAAWAEYEKVRAAWAEYEKVRAAWAEYEKVRDAAWAEYEKVCNPSHEHDCQDCTWNGKTIFPDA